MNHLVVFMLAIVSPGLDPILTPRLKSSQHPMRRIWNYILTVVRSLAMTLIACLAFPRAILLSPLPPTGIVGFAVAVGVTAGICWILGKPLLKVVRKPDLRAKTHGQFGALAFMLPQTKSERRWFALVCVSAGVCEEVLFRSFLIRYFVGAPWHFLLPLAFGLSWIIFGINHAYQGLKGVVSTCIVAACFSVIVIGFGSLIPAIVIHTLIDLRVLAFTLPVGHSLFAGEASELVVASVPAEATSSTT